MTDDPTSDASDPDEDLGRRLRAGARALSAAADAHRPAADAHGAGADPPGRRPRRVRMIAAAAVLVAVAVVATVAVATRDGDDADRVIADDVDRTECPAGADVIAVETDTGARDDRYFDGFRSVGVLRTDRPDEVTYLNEPSQVVSDPAISPRGDRVAVNWADGDYESAGPGSESIWAMAADGHDARPLTDGSSQASPTWSPDGRWVAFVERDWSTEAEHVAMIPAEGGDVRRLATVPIDSASSTTIAWTPDGGALVVAAGDPATLSIVDVASGDRREVTTLPAPVTWLTVVPGGEEVLGGIRTDRGVERLAVDLDTGDQRPVSGPEGELRWSADGRRAYLLDRSGNGWSGTLVHARYNGSAVEAGEPVTAFDGLLAFDVGPCVDHAVAPESAVDQPLLGASWVLGPLGVRLTEREPTSSCAGDDACRPVRVDVHEEEWRGDAPVAICTAYDAELRGDALTGEVAATDDCPSATDPRLGLPLRVEVDRSRLRATYATSAGEWTVVYGALFVGEAADPVEPAIPDGPALDDFAVTTTTAPTPDEAPCDQVTEFADRLAAAEVVTDLPPGGPPDRLADRARLVVRGFLTDTAIGSDPDAAPSELTFVYTLVVEEVLRADPDVDVAVGTEVGVRLTWVLGDRDHAAPPLGDLAGVGGLDSPDGAIPVVAFLTDEGTPYRMWQVDGPYGLAVGCGAQRVGGLVGEEGWGMEIGELADVARG